MTDPLEQKIITEVVQNVADWENGMQPIFGTMNEWAASYEMIDTRKSKKPNGVSKNLTAETPRAVNALASSITRMQTSDDPPFELRAQNPSDPNIEDKLYYMENFYRDMLVNTQFKRQLMKGNRGMCLFGTQVWEEPFIKAPENRQFPMYYPMMSGTDFRPRSLLEVAFRRSAYDIDSSDFLAILNRVEKNYLRYLANLGDGIWDAAKIEEAIKEKSEATNAAFSSSAIDDRRIRAKYQGLNEEKRHELIMYHGRLDTDDNPTIAEMWAKFGRKDDPKYCDITVGILNRRHIVRFHPTPYGSWHHSHKIGHYIEFELEPYAYGVGRLGGALQKDQNRILSRVNDVELFSLYNMFFDGGSGAQTSDLNIFPWSMIKVRDVNQIKEIRPQVEGILNGLKLLEYSRDDLRGVTHATDTLQAVISGATARESTLAQNEAIRAVSMIAEINSDAVLKPHFTTMHVNQTDQNPYDTNFVRNVDFIPKCTTDKDFRPEHSKMLLNFYLAVTSIRQSSPVDFDPTVILKYLARAAGIPPREINQPRPQLDRTLAILQRMQNNPGAKQEVAGEVAGAGHPDMQGNTPDQNPSPISALGVL